MTDFIALTCAVWIISYGLTSLDGPYGVFDMIREKLPHGRYKAKLDELPNQKSVTFQVGGLLDCIVCTSFWVGIALALLTGQPIVNGIGAAGLACLLHSYTGWKHGG